MGLHLNVDLIRKDNAKKEGVRKYINVLINQGDKLTSEEKKELKLKNKALYGLPRDFYQSVELPLAAELKVFRVDECLNHKKDISLVQRIRMLTDIEEHLVSKLTSDKQQQNIFITLMLITTSSLKMI